MVPAPAGYHSPQIGRPATLPRPLYDPAQVIVLQVVTSIHGSPAYDPGAELVPGHGMEQKKNDKGSDPAQRKWDNAGPDQATGRTGGEGGASYNEGEKPHERLKRDAAEDMRKGPLEQRSGRSDAQEGMADSLGGPGAGTNNPATDKEKRFGGSHTAGTRLHEGEDSEWKGGTPSQGPTTGGMGAAGGGHDTDETDVWKDKDRT
jgi:hypothetical protein